MSLDFIVHYIQHMPFPATGIFNGDTGYDPETLGLISLEGHFKDLFFAFLFYSNYMIIIVFALVKHLVKRQSWDGLWCF